MEFLDPLSQTVTAPPPFGIPVKSKKIPIQNNRSTPHIMDFTHGIPGPSTTLKTPMTNETQNNRSMPYIKYFTQKIPPPLRYSC